jgi:hypothetical protein
MSIPDRRRSARRLPDYGEPIRRVRSRTGHHLDVVNVSDLGLLVEGQARLLPNTHLDIHIVTRSGRVLVRCRVVRAAVCYIEADLVRYLVALGFERAVDTSGYPVPGIDRAAVDVAGSGYPPEASGRVAVTVASRTA